MSSEANARRLVMAAGGLAAVGLASLGATLLASDESTSQPVPIVSIVSTQAPVTLPATLVPTTTRPTTTVASTTPTTVPPGVTLEPGEVWVFNRASGQVAPFDFVTGTLAGDPQLSGLPDTVEYQSNGGTATLFDSEDGRLWVGTTTERVGATYPAGESTSVPGSQVVVTSAGDVLIVSKSGWYKFDPEASTSTTTLPTVPPSGSTTSTSSEVPPAAPVIVELEKVPDRFGDGSTVTAVGNTLVYLDDDGAVYIDDENSAKIPGEDQVLQQAGPAGDTVLVASSEGLFEVELGSDEAPKKLQQAEGTPARPVRAGECVFGAWSGANPTWSKTCDVTLVVAPLSGEALDGDLVFRVSEASVALNDVKSGAVWVEFASTKAVDDWSTVGNQS